MKKLKRRIKKGSVGRVNKDQTVYFYQKSYADLGKLSFISCLTEKEKHKSKDWPLMSILFSRFNNYLYGYDNQFELNLYLIVDLASTLSPPQFVKNAVDLMLPNSFHLK